MLQSQTKVRHYQFWLRMILVKIIAKILHFLAANFHTFGILSKHHSQNMAFQLELDTQLNDVVLKLNQESLIEVERSLLLQQAEVIVPLLKTKQSISLVIEEKFSQLRDDIGLMLSTNGCYDINHLTPYLENGHKDQRLSLMYILDWLFPDNAIFAFPKCATNCSNNKLMSPSPTPAVPRNIISASARKSENMVKQSCVRKRKCQIQNYPNLRKSENMVKQICTGKRKYKIQNCLNLWNLGNMV